MSIKTAEEHIQNGNLAEARAELQSGIRENPSNPAYRVFLFQLLCVAGDWERALTQLNVAADLDSSALLMAQAYRELLNCEVYRSEVFSGKRAPLMFGEPKQWIAPLVQALSVSANGDGASARKLVELAFEQADVRPGDLDGVPFEWIADADMRLGPVFEAMIDGKYYWIPMESVRRLSLSEPADLRDLVWTPAEFTWTNEGKSVGFVPTRYPGITPESEPGYAMARKTDWIDLGGEFFIGKGQRMFSSGESDHPTLQIRQLSFGNE